MEGRLETMTIKGQQDKDLCGGGTVLYFDQTCTFDKMTQHTNIQIPYANMHYLVLTF